MNSSRTELAREALAAARRVRIRARLSAENPLCVFDLVQDHFGGEVELRFKAAPSLEGLYVRGEPSIGVEGLIIVSSLRPSGRQRTTCAHELGHHLFGHGSVLDEVIQNGRSELFKPEEFLANAFAGFLTMPKLGVLKSFAERGLSVSTAPPAAFFIIASQFGVGYSTLIGHLEMTLGLLSTDRAQQLSKLAPKRLREELLGQAVPGELVVVDRHWRGRAIDLAVGDHVALPSGTTVEGDGLLHVGRCLLGEVYAGSRPGRGRIEHGDSNLAAFVRVSRSKFEGRAMFRHLEEVEEDG